MAVTSTSFTATLYIFFIATKNIYHGTTKYLLDQQF